MGAWIQISEAQAADIAALSATNRGNHFIAPTPDAVGDLWLSAEALDEPRFAHYAPVLSQLADVQPSVTPPDFAAQE